MRKLFARLHLWASVPFGVVIFCICFSGAMLVFEKEITSLFLQEVMMVERTAQPMAVEEVAERVAATLPGGVQVTGVTISSDPQMAYKVNLSKPRRAALWVDQYTGEVKGPSQRLPFFQTMFRLHRWLLGSAPVGGGIFWGKIIVGVSTLVFVLILISGLVVWWPRGMQMARHRFRICVSKGWHRFWYDTHVVGGFYTCVLLLLMALTGLTWSFGWYRSAFYQLFGVEVRQTAQHVARGEQGRDTLPPYLHWQKVYEELVRRRPEYKEITLSTGSATVAVPRYGNQRASDKYTYDCRSGEITRENLYADAALASKIRGWIYSVHVGSWGGLVTRILAFVASLGGAVFVVTGYYLWIRGLVRWKGRG